MTLSLRTFVAIRVPATPELTALGERLGTLGSAIRPVRLENLHITLKFLGETPRDRLAAIEDAVSRVAGRCGPFGLRMRGVSHMPQRRPRVVVAGFEPSQDTDLLGSMVQELEAALSAIGFPAEQRPFNPHSTLARIRSRPPSDRLEQLEIDYRDQPLGEFAVRDVELISSQLDRGGVEYRTLVAVPLGADESRGAGEP